MKYYFCDVFDTLALRSWARPTDLFFEVAYKLKKNNFIEVSESHYVKNRIQAELLERNKVEHGEVTLYDIYNTLSDTYNWPDTQKKIAISYEIESELDSAHVNSAMLQRIIKKRSEGYNIIYVSDMYLSSSIIQDILRKLNCWQDNDRIFVSGELKKNKASGSMFEYLKSEFVSKKVKHIGDNRISDFEIPISLGIEAEWYSGGLNNRYEQSNFSYCNPVQHMTRSKLEAISKIARLSYSGNETNKKVIWETGSNIIGPLFVSFVLWTLFEAERLGIKKLFFVARDGQILKKIADAITDKWDFKVSCHYIYGSRQAWHFPAILHLGEEEINWIFDPTDYLSIAILLERVNIDIMEVQETLIERGYPEKTWHKNLKESEREEIKKIFITSKINDLIIRRAAEHRMNAIGYLNQQGLFSNDVAIVDLGWNGRLQRSLSNLLNISGLDIQGTTGFYFKLFKKLKATENDKLYSFYESTNIETSLKDNFFHSLNVALIEIFAYADHGSTIKYTFESGKYNPVLRNGNIVGAIDWGLPIQHESVINYTNMIVSKFKKSADIINEMAEIGISNYCKFYNKPTILEAKVYGKFAMSEHQTESKFNYLAPIYGFRDVYNLLWLNKYKWHCEWQSAVQLVNRQLFRVMLSNKVTNVVNKIKIFITRLKGLTK